jgi:hypothetical protein
VWEVLHTDQPPNHQPYHGRVHPGFGGGAESLVVTAESPVEKQSSECSFDDPSSRKHVETGHGQILGPVDLVVWNVLGDPGVCEAMRRPQHVYGPAHHGLHPVAAFAPAVVARIQPEMLHPPQLSARLVIEN